MSDGGHLLGQTETRHALLKELQFLIFFRTVHETNSAGRPEVHTTNLRPNSRRYGVGLITPTD